MPCTTVGFHLLCAERVVDLGLHRDRVLLSGGVRESQGEIRSRRLQVALALYRAVDAKRAAAR